MQRGVSCSTKHASHWKIKPVPIIAILTNLTGCATSSVNYSPPTSQAIQSTQKIDQDFDVIWDRLVRKLSSDFFVINNIDKISRLINLSFATQRPSEFVDCGQTTRSFKNARGNQVYSYNADDSPQFISTSNQGHAFNVRRTSRLEGRVNIYIAPENNGTMVAVNTKYVVSVNTSAVGFDGSAAGSENFTFVFSTKQPFSDGNFSCSSLGSIEKKNLDFAIK